ncbi:MAG: Rdx family protein, partial [Planctomycetota bacterium]|nr:Rdx family protein [Planctomycetota bacterium]
MSVDDRPVIRIEYCTKCRWMIRASWLAQEFLSTFENELGGVTIAP